MITRRTFFKYGAVVGATAGVGALLNNHKWLFLRPGVAQALIPGLSDPTDPVRAPKFKEIVPNALDPSFIYNTSKGKIKVAVSAAIHQTGLVGNSGNKLLTPIWGYGTQQDKIYTWPGRTFQVRNGEPLEITWENRLKKQEPYLLTGMNGRPVYDTSLHWAYSLPGYTKFSIPKNGNPIVVHVHGSHSDFQYDGNPEFFFSSTNLRGPQWEEKKNNYDGSNEAGALWYHDHVLGLTRLNVYAGMAGFFFVRDNNDTGLPNNPLNLPAWPYELAYAIQDRMFKANGELFYPAFPGDPAYADFITGEGVVLPPDIFPGGGPTALAEFFGDHMVVNGKIWPKADVEPRNYRLRLLNGCDSRFLAIQFFEVPAGGTDFTNATGPLNFTVIGSDQGLASSPTTLTMLVFEPGSRYDLIFDFKQVALGKRVIMKNIGGDEPFGGDIPGPQVYGETDRIMAFDVTLPRDTSVPDVSPTANDINFGPNIPGNVTRVRKVALFEGMDEFGRLQPILGTAEPATDYAGNPINWPNELAYVNAGLVGQMEGAIAWHSPTTENPALNSTEIWEIYNATGDAHPIHLHLVNFEILDRKSFAADLVPQPVVQHNGAIGQGFRLENIQVGSTVSQPSGYVENAPKDMVTALPGQVTRIKMTFDKPGRYVWHCHILSHEDHEMMRVLHVGPGA